MGIKSILERNPVIPAIKDNITLEKALNSNHLSLKHVFKQLSTDWLDVTEIDSPHYWYKNINFQHDLDSLKKQINE